MLPRLLRGPIFHLDANLINARQKLDSVNRMEQWRDEGVILLVMAGVAHEEAQAGAGGNVEARKRKAAGHIDTINCDDDAKAAVQSGYYVNVSDVCSRNAELNRLVEELSVAVGR
jgi:hypothetical protein